MNDSPLRPARTEHSGGETERADLQLAAAHANPFVGMSRQFFGGGDRARQLEELRHLNRWPRRLVAVTGSRGVGKSALYRALSGRLDTGVKAARINANLTSDARDVLMGVLQGLGAPAPGSAVARALADLVVAHVEAQVALGRQCLVLVDDAHLLDWRALEELLRIVDATSSDALRIAFFAQAPFIQSLERGCSLMAHVRAWHEIRLVPFNEADTRHYIAFRLKDAGVVGRVPFSADELELVWRQSRGLPGHVNELAAALVDGALRVVDEGRFLPRGHRAVALMLAAVVLSSWLIVTAWQRDQPDTRIEAAGTAPADADLRGSGDTERSVGTLALPSSGDTAPVERPEIGPTSVNAGEGTVDRALAQRVEPKATPAVPDAVAVEAAAAPTERETERPSVVGPAPAAAPTSAPSEPAKASAASPATAVRAPAASVSVPAAASGATWFFDQPRAHHTLQLFGTSNRAEWQRWVSAHADPAVASFETVRDGKPWFVVTYGSYASRAEADAAAKRLPASLGAPKPWVRTFGAIQDSIGR